MKYWARPGGRDNANIVPYKFNLVCRHPDSTCPIFFLSTIKNNKALFPGSSWGEGYIVLIQAMKKVQSKHPKRRTA